MRNTNASIIIISRSAEKQGCFWLHFSQRILHKNGVQCFVGYVSLNYSTRTRPHQNRVIRMYHMRGCNLQVEWLYR